MNQERIFSRRLRRLWAVARRRVVLLGLLRTGAVVLPACALAVWVAGSPHSPGRVLLSGLSLSLLMLGVLLAWDQILAPWRRLDSPRALAWRLESQQRCRNMILAAEEAAGARLAAEAENPVTRELLQRVLAGADEALNRVRMSELFPLRQGRAVAGGLALGLILLVALGVTDPEGLRNGVSRLVRPAKTSPVIFRGGIYPESGPEFVVAGRKVTLGAKDFGSGDEAAVCQIRAGTGNWQDLPALQVPASTGVPAMQQPFRRLQAETGVVQDDFVWRFKRGERLSSERGVRVLHHPLLTNLAGRIIPPDYTRAPTRDLGILPALSEVPVGGMLQLIGTTNGPVLGAQIALAGGDTLAMVVDSVTVRGELPITDEVSFQVLLQGEHGLRNLNPLVYKVNPVPDQAPGVRLERPADDGILPLGGRIRLVVEAADDYGLRDIRLMLRPRGGRAGRDPASGWQGGVVWPAADDSVRGLDSLVGPWQARVTRSDGVFGALQSRLELVADLARLELVSGEGVELVAVARDNQEPGGGQTGWSDVLTLVLPAAADVLLDQAQASESRLSELEDARNRTRKLGKDLDRLTRELMKNPTPDWAKQQEMEETIARRRELQKQLADMSSRLQQELERLAANQMTSERQLAQADQVAALLQQQDKTALADALKKMEDKPGSLDPRDIANALQEVARDQKDLARRMDAALSMLKKMDQEQELEGMTSLLEKIMREQQKLAEQSRELADKQQHGEKGQPQGEQEGKPAEAEKKTGEDLAARQQELAKDMAQLEQQMKKAVEDAGKRDQDGQSSKQEQQRQQDLQEALDQLKQQQSRDKMSQAGEQLQKMNPEQAAKMQEQALRDLGSLYHVLLQTQEAMQMAMQKHQIKSLRGLAADMLDLSARQETIAQTIPAQMRDVRALAVTRSQFRMQQAAMEIRRKLSALSGEAPLRILALLKKLDSLIEVMGYDVNALEAGQGSAAQRQSREALAQANKIIIGLLTEAQMNGAGKGGGSDSQPSLAEQLMKMLKEQSGLNGMTEELRRMLANRGLSQETRARMKRLGEAQGDLAGRMQDLAEQEKVRPDGERLLGDLAHLGQDMESVTDDITGGQVSEETLRRQERILSRMLDARNSVRQRDFSTRRESRTALRIYGDAQQGSVPTEQDPRRFLLRYQSLDSAPPDYQGLVRRYFSALDSLQRLGDTLPGPGRTP